MRLYDGKLIDEEKMQTFAAAYIELETFSDRVIPNKGTRLESGVVVSNFAKLMAEYSEYLASRN